MIRTITVYGVVCALPLNAFALTTDSAVAWLTTGQYDVMKRIESGEAHFGTAIYGGDVDGVQRTVVFLGESHVESRRNARLGRQALDQFGAYGLEGADTSKNWGGAVFLAGIVTVFSVLRFFSFGTTAEKSTLYQAWDLGGPRFLYETFKRQIAEQGLEALPPEKLAKVRLEVMGLKIKATKAIEYVRTMETKVNNEPFIVALERSHRPGLGENVFSVAFPVAIVALAYYAGRGMISQVRTAIRGDYTIALAGLAGMVLPTVGIISFNKIFPDNWLDRAFTAPWKPMLDGRNETMSLNIFQAFKDYPDLRTLLVIVGRAHVEGLGQIVHDRYGFERVSLEQVEQTAEPAQVKPVP